MGFYSPQNVKESRVSFTFDGTAGKGAIGNCTLFTVTDGIHVVAIDPIVTTNVGVDGGTGVASLSLGVTNATTLFVAATTATDLTAANGLWYSTTPNGNGIALPAAYKDIAVKQNIVAAVTSTGTQKVTSGVLEVVLLWVPVTANAAVA